MPIQYKPPSHAKPLDLRSPFLKVKWARDHIQELNAMRMGFTAQRYFGIPKYSAETDSTQFLMPDFQAVPDSVSLVLGDAAHNLRTALDHLACELAPSVGVLNPKVYFPICQSQDVYEAEYTGKTKGIPNEAKDTIDSIRPYGGGSDFLWGLHEIDRIDKHRLIVPIAAATSSWSATITAGIGNHNLSFGIGNAVKVGDKIGEFPGNYESRKQMSVALDIAFGEPEVFKTWRLFPTLDLIANQVNEALSMFGDNPLGK